jgi:hypothetical protein
VKVIPSEGITAAAAINQIVAFIAINKIIGIRRAAVWRVTLDTRGD